MLGATLLGLLLAAAPARAQPAPYVDPAFTLRQWTVRDGLPLDAINGLVQAADGFLWLAVPPTDYAASPPGDT